MAEKGLTCSSTDSFTPPRSLTLSCLVPAVFDRRRCLSVAICIVVTRFRVVDWVQCQDMVSAASFSPDGQLAAAGLYNGRVMFYHTTGLRYYTQVSEALEKQTMPGELF